MLTTELKISKSKMFFLLKIVTLRNVNVYKTSPSIRNYVIHQRKKLERTVQKGSLCKFITDILISYMSNSNRYLAIFFCKDELQSVTLCTAIMLLLFFFFPLPPKYIAIGKNFLLQFHFIRKRWCEFVLDCW